MSASHLLVTDKRRDQQQRVSDGKVKSQAMSMMKVSFFDSDSASDISAVERQSDHRSGSTTDGFGSSVPEPST